MIKIDSYLDIYPLTIIMDRYRGSYSGGVFTAWNLEYDQIPMDVSDSDIECRNFFYRTKLIYGVGDTPEEAAQDLYNKVKGI